MCVRYMNNSYFLNEFKRSAYICPYDSCHKIDFRVLGHDWQALVCSAQTFVQLRKCCFYLIICQCLTL